uniref:RRM domain-containing protein n=1 Tax=Sinocyclocheilus grahami TaxID=75366 RepID=A0A672MMP7_SINGR
PETNGKQSYTLNNSILINKINCKMPVSFKWSSSEDNMQQRDLSWPLLVSNLHPLVDKLMLHVVFDPFGPICSLQVFRSRNNFCRGYALVTFEHRSDAKNALEALDFSELLDKRPISSHAPRSLLVSNLMTCVSEEELLEVFIPFGPISTVHVCRNELTKVSRGFGFVTFKQRRDAESALEALNFSELFGKKVCISWVQDTTAEALLRSSSPQDNWDVPEASHPKPVKQSLGRKLVNTAKNALTAVLTSPEGWVVIGLLATAWPFFSFGPISTVHVKINKVSRGYGFITFKHRCDAESALEALNFSEFLGKSVCISWAHDTAGRGPIEEQQPSRQLGYYRSKPSLSLSSNHWGESL